MFEAFDCEYWIVLGSGVVHQSYFRIPYLFLQSQWCWWFYRYATSQNNKYYINNLKFIFDAYKDRLYNLKMFNRLEVWVHYKNEATERNEAQSFKVYDKIDTVSHGHLGLCDSEYLILKTKKIGTILLQFINRSS